jgi:hypothetical protein
MRLYRISFIGGLAIGYVLGAQAGRERYEQLKQIAKKASENPTVQQTAGALQAQATSTAKSAKDLAASGMRTGAAKVTSMRSSDSRTSHAGPSASGNGNGPRTTGSDGSRPFVPTNGNFGQQDLI